MNIHQAIIKPVGRTHTVVQEALTALRFALVGIGATAVHISVVWLLITQVSMAAHMANGLAFICAFGWSFAGNYWWTFSRPNAPSQAIRRFALIALLGFSINSLILAALLESALLAAHYAALVSAAVVPFISYLASRLWAFKG